MSKYTEDQLYNAIIMAQTFGPAPVECSTNDLRRMLDHLPDQPDEWQECGANDLQSGDVYRAESPDANIAYKKPIEKCAIVGDWLEVQHVGGMKSSAKISTNTFYRIPAPITRPNPEQYPIILAYEWETDDGLVRNPFNSDLFEWNDHTNNYQGKWNALTPEIITDWDPLEIASKEVTTDE